jgi:hypothetical protein
MRAGVGILRTLDHNLRAKKMDQRWYQYLADNFDVPVSQLPVVLSHVRNPAGHSCTRKIRFFTGLPKHANQASPQCPHTLGRISRSVIRKSAEVRIVGR